MTTSDDDLSMVYGLLLSYLSEEKEYKTRLVLEVQYSLTNFYGFDLFKKCEVLPVVKLSLCIEI